MANRTTTAALLLALVSCAHGSRSGTGADEAAGEAPPIAWADWSEASFERAAREGRYLLVSVQAVWCHWCHVMNDETFGDPRVRSLVAEHYVPIAVDSDARPDLADRFRDYAWPATILLSPDAEIVVALRGYRAPDVFARLLAEVANGERPPAPPEEPAGVDVDLAALRDAARERFDGLYDADTGGWGYRQKYPYAAPVEHAFFRAEALGESRWTGRALATLEGYARLIDPVDGGVYQYSLRNDWDHPHFERIAAVQAGALASFAEAYRLTGEGRWKERAAKVLGYLDAVLAAPEGGWYASQDADLDHETSGTVYFAQDAAGRARLGTPPVDRHVYVDLDGRILVALVAAARAGIEGALERARVAAERIEGTRAEEGLFPHEVSPREVSPHEGGAPTSLRYLRDQAWMLRAEVALFEATGASTWRERAERTAAAMESSLLRASEEGGGFFAHTPDPAARGVFAERRVPLQENGVAARGLLRLARIANDERYLALAESALRSQSLAAIEAAGRRGGHYLLALEERLGPYVLLSIVGPDDERTARLHQAAFELPLPHRLVDLGRPGAARYPYPGEPAVFLCNEAACSMPISDPDRLAEQARLLLSER